MKALLSRTGRPFVVKNVDEDDGSYDELLALGQRTIPVTRVGATLIRGFDPAAILAALDGNEKRETPNVE